MSSTAAEAQLAANTRDAEQLLELARRAHRRGDDEGALEALAGVVDASDSFAVWLGASALLGKLRVEGSPRAR